jgi:phage gp36-like protein
MNRFLTADEFKTRVGLDELMQIAGLGNLNSAEGRVLDLPKIEEAIAFSQDLLIGYARQRYAVIETLTPETTPDLVKGLVADVARYRLRSRSGGQGQVSAEVLKRYEDALSFYKSVASGKAELPIAGEPVNGEAGSAFVHAIIPPSPVASMLQGWRP